MTKRPSRSTQTKNKKKGPSSKAEATPKQPASLTQERMEAELETRIATTIRTAFAGVNSETIVQQRRFKIRLGHETHEFDSAALWEKTGRADIILFHNKRPLAVLEIKRESVALDPKDYEQAQSYANMLTPRPPLVIVSNGNETQCYDANTGKSWTPPADGDEGIRRLFENAAKLASSDMRWAIDALMGREADVWLRIVRGCTNHLLAHLTDLPGNSGRPLARDLLFPRAATRQLIEALKGENRFAIVEGPPAIGKTSLLRELANLTEDSDDFAVLLLEGSGPGLYQAIANVFAAELEWTLSPDDARNWLRRMSIGEAGPTLVIAIDGVVPGTQLATDLQELVGLIPGNRLKVVFTADQSEGLVRTANGRGLTGLGIHCTELELGPLGLDEFAAAAQALEDARIFFGDGAQYCEDYRAPWVLRTIYDNVVRDHRHGTGTSGVMLAPALDLGLIAMAQDIYAGQAELLRGYRVLARDCLNDEQSSSGHFALEQSNGFVVRQDALSQETRQRLLDLRAAGHVRTFRRGRDDVVVPTVPAAFAMELAEAAAEVLKALCEADPKEAGKWLGRRLEGMYLGDLIGARAIMILAEITGGFSSGLVFGLLSIKPREELVENKLVAFATPDGKLVHLKIDDGKAWISDRFGNVKGDPVDLGAERSQMLGDVVAWMILGLLAHFPSAELEDERMDARILFEIGQCPFPLMRANEHGLGHFEHDFGELGRVLCTQQGAIEATTRALANLFSRPWKHADGFIDAALETNSLALLNRLIIALREVSKRQIDECSQWAEKMVRDVLSPAVTQIVTDHAKSIADKPSRKTESARSRRKTKRPGRKPPPKT